MSVHIWWIRRDLRLHDNPALEQAARAAQLVPLFILDPHLLSQEAPARQAFLFSGLRSLDAALRARGSRLILRRGQPLDVLRQVAAESGAQAIFALEDYSPYARRRDAQVARALPLTLLTGVTVHHPLAVRKPDGGPYTVFTPFSRAWKALPLPSPLIGALSLPGVPPLSSLDIPAALPHPLFPPGEDEAILRLERFLGGPAEEYAAGRNRLDLDGTSALSPYFHLGMLSPRLAVQRALEYARQAAHPAARSGYETWLNELIWREFYQAILYEFPQVLRHAFNPAMRRIAWRDAPQDLSAWQQGLSGYPIVDACMRQLLSTGWMHNRGRMIVASFLAKDLLINWQEGERWFMRHLVDGDLAANNGGWQWTAGVGTDAAPYFRVFNPVLQGQKFDPQGVFVRRWLPELRRVPDEHIHAPWRMPAPLQRAVGLLIGQDYPAPLVDHAEARLRALEAYRAAGRQ